MGSMIKSNLVLGAVALLLAGCGFQLRGTGQYNLSLKEIDVQARDSYGQTIKDVRTMLQDNGVQVTNGAHYHLILGEEHQHTRDITYAAGVRSVEVEVVITMPYEIRGAVKDPLIKNSISVERFYSRDSGNPLGNDNEVNNLVAEMHQELLQRFFLHLHSLTPERLDQLEQAAEARARAVQEFKRHAHEEAMHPGDAPDPTLDPNHIQPAPGDYSPAPGTYAPLNSPGPDQGGYGPDQGDYQPYQGGYTPDQGTYQPQ